ncbi:unnamed protein product [Dracunculus medinensis]|uniref:mRNA (guanine-N(7))-methyltransferase n=1 Tax=Dracunculus medinensis TaxID=318479 RepID=A0A0N4U0I8_DRAME|nr:unnamed protein product [Dracunculus medinensis]
MNVANSSEVIEHYNSVPNTGIREREGVRIYYLRCFNNWIKTKLFNKAEILLREQGRSNLVGLDLCCGKGGDLLKWNHMDVSHVVFTVKLVFRLIFFQEHLKDLYKNPAIEFDLCSCQFSFHYAFETERQARVMIRNAIEMLKPGGLFLGTLPEAERIMFFLRKGFGCYSNDVVRLTYGDQELFQKENYRPPIFGAKFHFALEEQVFF